jgi:hypothetical protein
MQLLINFKENCQHGLGVDGVAMVAVVFGSDL